MGYSLQRDNEFFSEILRYSYIVALRFNVYTKRTEVAGIAPVFCTVLYYKVKKRNRGIIFAYKMRNKILWP